MQTTEPSTTHVKSTCCKPCGTRKGYIVYGEILDFYLRHGVQMTHIYCIITFRVANW